MSAGSRRRTIEQLAFVQLQRTADGFQQAITEFLKRYELSPTQFNALRILRGAGAEGLPSGEIGARLINKDPDITRLLDRLEKRGLVRRGRGERDRRQIVAHLTPAGLRLLEQLDEPVLAHHRETLGHLKAGELKELIRLLQAAGESFSR